MSASPSSESIIPRPPDRVLFLCVHNSSRSQMAEGFARAMAPESTLVMSAGSEPRGVHAEAIAAMAEVGVDIRSQTSKSLAEVPWQQADLVVTLCNEGAEVCPQLATGVRRVHWLLPDPGAEPPERQPEAFREMRDEIRWRVASLWPRGD